MDAVSRTVTIIPRERATKELASSCAQRAQARGEDGVLSSISTSQSTSAELLVLGRQDTICAGAIRRFCEGAPVSNIPGTRHKSVHRIASARFRRKNGAPGVDECNIATISCSRAIALLRYCAIAKLIANGSP